MSEGRDTPFRFPVPRHIQHILRFNSAHRGVQQATLALRLATSRMWYVQTTTGQSRGQRGLDPGT